MDELILLIGRFHPLIVHFPVAILLLAFLFELLSRIRAFKKLKSAVLPTLLIGVLGSLLAIATGLVLAQEGGYDDDLLSTHRTLGILTAIVSCAAYLLCKLYPGWNKIQRRRMRLLALIPVAMLVSLTGHWGGSLTHGEGYLTALISDEYSQTPEKIILPHLDSLDDAIMYVDVIEPILEVRCYSCHSSQKQKGGLRLDSREYIMNGGKHGDVFNVLPNSSALYHRMILPTSDKKHMPPNENPQPGSAEIDLIHSWITNGYRFDQKISDLKDRDKVKGFVAAIHSLQTARPHWVPDDPVEPASTSAIEKLKERGVLVMPVAGGSNYLMANFVNARKAGDEELELLLPIQDQLLWLDLGHTQISNTGATTIGKLIMLRYLYLNNTNIDDPGIAQLTSLSNLIYLNLVATQTTADALGAIDSLQALQQLYTFQSKISQGALQEFAKRNRQVAVDTGGYELPAIASDTIIHSRTK